MFLHGYLNSKFICEATFVQCFFFQQILWFSQQKSLGTFWNFFGVACVNLNNLAIIFFAKIHKKLDKSKHGVGVVDITLWKYHFKPVL